MERIRYELDWWCPLWHRAYRVGMWAFYACLVITAIGAFASPTSMLDGWEPAGGAGLLLCGAFAAFAQWLAGEGSAEGL